MRIAIAQINPIVGDIVRNKEKILLYIKIAREKKADLVVFPELALCGYFPQDLLILPSFYEMVEKELRSLASHTDNLSVIVGGIRKNPGKKEKMLFNTAAIFSNGELLGFQDKSLLPTYDVFTERRYFEPASHVQTWDLCKKRLAVTICEDIWQHAEEVGFCDYHIDPVMLLKNARPDLLINISASPFYMGRQATRLKVAAKAARTLKCPLVLCNTVGANDGLLFDGTSLFIDQNGKLIQEAASFKEDLLIVDSEKPEVVSKVSSKTVSDLYDALVMGIKDYFQKLGFQKAILGLSGGIDSAVVACIAKEALGNKNVLALMMPSRFTSEMSLKDASKLSSHLGIEYREISIEESFQTVLKTLDFPLPFDVTEENLQSRLRANILMSFSNKFGYIVLSASNKSESALGYATLYGDMTGGLSVLGDVSKSNVYLLADWINRNQEIIPKNIITRAPSAELKEGQKDSDSLPSYEVIDAVLTGYVEEHLSPEEIASKYNITFALVKDLVKRIHLNEYKRRQAPLSLRVTQRSFSTGRHFPIVQHWNI